jgi:hypothetical protein
MKHQSEERVGTLTPPEGVLATCPKCGEQITKVDIHQTHAHMQPCGCPIGRRRFKRWMNKQ